MDLNAAVKTVEVTTLTCKHTYTMYGYIYTYTYAYIYIYVYVYTPLRDHKKIVVRI